MDWVPFVLEDAKHALMRWPGAQDRGMWIAGFYSGAAQALTMGGEAEAFLDGYASGSVARGDAEKNRSRISAVRQAAARSRWDREQPKQIVMDANAYAVVDAQADANACAPAMHKTDKTRQDRTGKTEQEQHPPTPSRGKRASTTRFVSPSESEWVAYCTATWPDWHPTCAADSWAYYESKGWRIGTAPCRDWKAAARTSHGNARTWGKLQPTPAQQSARPFGRPGPASLRASVDQALIDQIEGQKNGSQDDLGFIPRDTTAEFGW